MPAMDDHPLLGSSASARCCTLSPYSCVLCLLLQVLYGRLGRENINLEE